MSTPIAITAIICITILFIVKITTSEERRTKENIAKTVTDKYIQYRVFNNEDEKEES